MCIPRGIGSNGPEPGTLGGTIPGCGTGSKGPVPGTFIGCEYPPEG